MVALPAGAAGQATLATNLPCYSPGEGIRFTGSGYTPNAAITIGLAGNGQSGHYDATADAAGALAYTGRAPNLDDFGASPPRVRLQASATDQTTHGATTAFTLSDWDLLILPWETSTPARGKPGRMVTLRTYGWTSLSGTLYAHYVRRGLLLHTVALGRLRGSCGDLTRKMREFPFRPVPAGRYVVQFDVRPRYVNRGPRLGYPRGVVVAPEDAVP